MPRRYAALAGGLLLSVPVVLWAASGQAQDWRRNDQRYQQRNDAAPPAGADEESEEPPRADRRPDNRPGGNRDNQRRDAYDDDRRSSDTYPPPPRGSGRAPPADDAYRPPSRYGNAPDQPQDRAYRPPARGSDDAYERPRPGYGAPPGPPPGPPYGRPYGPPPDQAYNEPSPRERGYGPPYRDDRYRGPPGRDDEVAEEGFSPREILDTGHGFFGSVSKGLASIVEYVFQKQGRPNGYILGQEAGGALIAGLRYGEGVLYTKDAGTRRIYWQGPSIGYDVGGEGSKVMMLVYNLRDPEDIYQRFGGIDGSAYLVGGVGVTFLTNESVVVAPIRAGVGLRLGANVGYLKYTRRPTWNPF